MASAQTPSVGIPIDYDFNQHSVKQLQELLKHLKMHVSGKKAELIARIRTAEPDAWSKVPAECLKTFRPDGNNAGTSSSQSDSEVEDADARENLNVRTDTEAEQRISGEIESLKQKFNLLELEVKSLEEKKSFNTN